MTDNMDKVKKTVTDRCEKYRNFFTKEYLMGPNSVRLLDEMLKKYPLQAGSRVMDLGCGAGNAALHFSKKGYDVLAVDGCPELCEHTRRRVGCPVRVLRFDELDYENAFDGVWACASLLHLRMNELPRVLRLIRRSLKSGGVSTRPSSTEKPSGTRTEEFFPI